METEYTVLDPNGEACGALRLAICPDFASLDKVMGFSRLEQGAIFQNHPSPTSCGFQFFEEQLPIEEIYPVAVLEDLEIAYRKRKQGLGRRAVRAFRAVAEEHHCRLGLLRIGTTGADADYETGMHWRKRFYESESWVSLGTPPLDGLIIVWMCHLLPPLTAEERGWRKCLAEKPSEDNFPWSPLPQDGSQ